MTATQLQGYDEREARIDQAGALLGRDVVFRHRPAGVQPARVTTVTGDGMVELEGWAGEFAPHLFEVVE